jgi:hypothetical protein
MVKITYYVNKLLIEFEWYCWVGLGTIPHISAVMLHCTLSQESTATRTYKRFSTDKAADIVIPKYFPVSNVHMAYG